MIDEMMWVFQALLAITAIIKGAHYLRDKDDDSLKQTMRILGVLVLLVGMGFSLPHPEPWTFLFLEGGHELWLSSLLGGALSTVAILATFGVAYATACHFSGGSYQFGC